MICQNDILGEIGHNVDVLIGRLNKLENLSGVHFTIGSGFRLTTDQLRIYKEKGITDIAKIPMQSKHFFGQAADLHSDRLDELKYWILNNQQIITQIGLWFEDFNYTPNWVHCQIVPPNSGKMFFIPQ